MTKGCYDALHRGAAEKRREIRLVGLNTEWYFKAWNNYSFDAEPQTNTFPMTEISPGCLDAVKLFFAKLQSLAPWEMKRR